MGRCHSVFLEIRFFQIRGIDLVLCFFFDRKRFMFLGAVSLISRMIFLYCLYYMDIEKNDRRFRIILFLFILSMVFLIVSPNLARILLG